MFLDSFLRFMNIVLQDLVLSGDNALALGAAAADLPPHQQRKAIFWGGIIAAGIRVVLTVVASYLLLVPGIQVAGGLMLTAVVASIARQAMEEPRNQTQRLSGTRTSFAGVLLKMVWADVSTGLDNVLAVAASSHGNWLLMGVGLLMSIVLIFTVGGAIAALIHRWRSLYWVAAVILMFTGSGMLAEDQWVRSNLSPLIDTGLRINVFLFPIFVSWLLVLSLGVCVVGSAVAYQVLSWLGKK